jgi:hypothetical protein
MTDSKSSGGNGRQFLTEGHRPLPSQPSQKGYQPNPANAPGKVQGGYQAPGGGKPATPTTGSGVTTAPASTPPSDGKK